MTSKTRLPLGLLTTLLAPLGACSNDDGIPRDSAVAPITPAGGSGGQTSVAPAGGASSGPTASAGSGGAAPGGAPAVRLGEALDFVAGTGEVPYAIGDNAYGIRGGAFRARSMLGNTITVGTTPGEICISGNLEEVPAGNYGQYWGVEIGFNLNQGPVGEALTAPPTSAVTADAGIDAGIDAIDAGAAPPAEVAQPWLPSEVRGFSFVIEGPTINLIRFKALPAGFDPSLESSVFCKTIMATSGAEQTALFGEMTQYCWNPESTALLPTGAGLANISWQLPADVAPAGARPFDWCLRDLRPILAD
jgi:hypothetical protein